MPALLLVPSTSPIPQLYKKKFFFNPYIVGLPLKTDLLCLAHLMKENTPDNHPLCKQVGLKENTQKLSHMCRYYSNASTEALP